MDKENKPQNIDANREADYGEDEDVVSYSPVIITAAISVCVSDPHRSDCICLVEK